MVTSRALLFIVRIDLFLLTLPSSVSRSLFSYRADFLNSPSG